MSKKLRRESRELEKRMDEIQNRKQRLDEILREEARRLSDALAKPPSRKSLREITSIRVNTERRAEECEALKQELLLIADRLAEIGAGAAATSPEAGVLYPRDGPGNLLERLDSLDGHSFEAYLARLFESQGFSVEHVGATGGDQGADLILTSVGGERIAVQAKRYSGSVGNAAVQEVYASASYYGADQAWVITTSSFTPSAVELSKRIGVKLFDRAALTDFISGQYREETIL